MDSLAFGFSIQQTSLRQEALECEDDACDTNDGYIAQRPR